MSRHGSQTKHLVQLNSLKNTRECAVICGNQPLIASTPSGICKLLDNVTWTSFETSTSPRRSPNEWLLAHASHINSSVLNVMSDTRIPESRLTILLENDCRVYPRLTFFLLLHSMLCTNDNSFLNNIENTLKEWRDWDIITMLGNHHSIQMYLLEKLKASLQLCNGFHPENLLDKLLAIDAIVLAAQLEVTITDNVHYKEFLTRRGSEAQALLDLLQSFLFSVVDLTIKPRFVEAIIELSKYSGLNPELLVFRGVQRGIYPVAAGGVADIWFVQHSDRNIVIKIRRLAVAPEGFELMKQTMFEAAVLRGLSHPNVLPLYGLCDFRRHQSHGLGLAFPHISNGTLFKFLKPGPLHTNCLLLILDIAHGLEYLHQEKIVHGNLDPRTILISSSRRALLAGFSGAFPMDLRNVLAPSSNGDMRYMAPELLGHRAFKSYATDVYAFALVCYMVFSGKQPFEGQTLSRVVWDLLDGRRPLRPRDLSAQASGLNDEMWSLIEACWDANPEKRPTASQIVDRLREMPGMPEDNRPHDDFDFPDLSRASYTKSGHPFSYLQPSQVDL